ARLPPTRHVVDLAVAIVVDAVAHLGQAGDPSEAGALAGDALVGPRQASHRAAGVPAVGEVARRAAGVVQPAVGEVVVDHAVAVVVHAVADLGRGAHRA